jgi:inorganic pyrophosphatase
VRSLVAGRDARQGSDIHHDAMTNLLKIPARDENGDVHVVVETPRGSKVKLAYDPELKVIGLSRALVTGLAYPHDWGFVPSTLAEDGDPLDVMVLTDWATAPGVVMKCKIIGVIRMSQKKKGGGRERNDRVLAVPVCAPRADGLTDPRDLPERTRRELEQFFLDVDDLTEKEAKVEGWGGPKDALGCVEEAMSRLQSKREKAA